MMRLIPSLRNVNLTSLAKTALKRPPHVTRQTTRNLSLQSVTRVNSTLYDYPVSEFRNTGFVPELPLLITPSNEVPNVQICTDSAIPALRKWFSCKDASVERHGLTWRVNHGYLQLFEDTVLPYEFILPSKSHVEKFASFKAFYMTLRDLESAESSNSGAMPLHEFLPDPGDVSNGSEATFVSFSAPLALFLKASQKHSKYQNSSDNFFQLSELYIAQAQIRDLPKELQDDLPTPGLVTRAGKGDIYDANIWLGTPPTYTPLHKDPNPNLFAQLAGLKTVRIFRPEIGRSIFHAVQSELQRHGSSSIRGEEMMQGAERALLDKAVWDEPAFEGLEATVKPGDALFIPKGWWHSIKSVKNNDVNCSVNWWFR